MSREARPASLHPDPPRTIRGVARQLGPGLIISANIVGSGELIVTTKLGGDAGFALLWFIVFGCMIKVLLQVELGRYTILSGKSTLDALDSVPGPRLGVSWLNWCWLLMFVATFVQLSGIVGGIAGILRAGGAALGDAVLALLVTGSCAAFLILGRYAFIERFSTAMVAAFSAITLAAVFSLNWTGFGIAAEDIAAGFRFRLPEDFTVAFAAFGVIGVGASELIYYPYWCLEKGYARHVGPNDGSAEWSVRARGWLRVLKWDAWLSMVIYTTITVAFYLLGAAVLNSQGLVVSNADLVPTLSRVYSDAFGSWGLWVFLVGAFVVLYSTVFISTASNARLTVDVLRLFRLIRIGNDVRREHWVRTACIALPALYFLLFTAVGSPVSLVLVGAVAQAMMLPFICFAALYHLYRHTAAEVSPSPAWQAFLWLSAVLMTATGTYQLLSITGIV
jgi:manganese transport protein